MIISKSCIIHIFSRRYIQLLELSVSEITLNLTLKLIFLLFFLLNSDSWFNAHPLSDSNNNNSIITGAEQTEKYLSYLKGKRVALLANPRTIIGKKHLADSLLSVGINVVKVFGPEHGFRGNASNGAKVSDEKDLPLKNYQPYNFFENDFYFGLILIFDPQTPLPAGTYFIKAISKQHQSGVMQFVKN